MSTRSAGTREPAARRGLTGWIRHRPVTAFLVGAYALSWGWWWAIAAAGGIVRPGLVWPTHIPGLLGPAVAAFVVSAVVDGRGGVIDLARRVVRLPGGWRPAVLAISPLGMLVAGVLVVRVVDGHWPVWADMSAISGLPREVVPMLIGLVVLNGVGEETGWRGFAQERLQRRHGPVRAALLVTVAWALWHLPLFVILASFRGFSPATLPGFFLGMTAGAVVLAYCYNAALGSVAAAVLWHVTYNLASAPVAAQGMIAAVVTSIVMVWAVWLLAASRRAHRRGEASPLWAGRSPVQG